MRNVHLLPATLIIGILTSQILFAVMVHDSNILLDQTISMLSSAGYLTVPNHLVTSGLRDWTPAIAGALFFSLTAGAGLSLASFIVILAWRSLMGGRRIGLLIVGAFWAVLLFRVNDNGFNGWATAACILIPLTVSAATLVMVSVNTKPSAWCALAFPVAGFLVLIAFWAPRADGDTFIRIRDHLLLSSSPGEKITRFYYQYTLYPAEVFKSPDQKLIKACVIQVNDPDVGKSIEHVLRDGDYLRVDEKKPVTLWITEDNGQLILRQKDRVILSVTTNDFMHDPEKILNDFSKKTDKWGCFRRITFMSLVIASPFLVFLLAQSIIFICLIPMRSVRLRMALSTLICAGIGIALSFPVGSTGETPLTGTEIEKNLFSAKRFDRIEALKALSETKMDIDAYPALINSAHQRTVPERYWLAKALGGSRSARTERLLRELLKDPHPNVVCMALLSLGNRRQKQATDDMIHLIKTSDHWYVQWYAYRSLRSLGWIQPASACCN